MSSAYNFYTKGEKLGRGSFGAVFKGWSRTTGTVVAMKEISLIGPGASTASTVEREVLALKTLRHRNIVRLHDVYYEQTKVTLILEYCYQDLRSFMNRYGHGGALDSVTIRSFMKQLLRGIKFCHRHNFYHRDLKPDNILTHYADEKWVLKIADLGLASSINLGEHRTFVVTTIYYRAPELFLRCTTYSTQIDIWSTGCIFAEMLCGALLFRPASYFLHGQLECIVSTHGSPSDAQLQSMKRAHPEIVPWPIPSHYSRIPWKRRLPMASTAVIALLDRFLKFDPAERISAAEALSDVYFKNVQQPQQSSRPIQHQASQSYYPQRKIDPQPQTNVQCRALPVQDRVTAQRKKDPPAYHQPQPNVQCRALPAQDRVTVAPVCPNPFIPPQPIRRQPPTIRHLPPTIRRLPQPQPLRDHTKHLEFAKAHEASHYGNAEPLHGSMAGFYMFK